jgi:hypothetical protein
MRRLLLPLLFRCPPSLLWGHFWILLFGYFLHTNI